MTNPPDRPRDDRRMHEGRKPGLDEPENQGEETATLEQRDTEATADAVPDHPEPSANRGDPGTPDRESGDKGGDKVQQAHSWSGGSAGSKGS